MACFSGLFMPILYNITIIFPTTYLQFCIITQSILLSTGQPNSLQLQIKGEPMIFDFPEQVPTVWMWEKSLTNNSPLVQYTTVCSSSFIHFGPFVRFNNIMQTTTANRWCHLAVVVMGKSENHTWGIVAQVTDEPTSSAIISSWGERGKCNEPERSDTQAEGDCNWMNEWHGRGGGAAAWPL